MSDITRNRHQGADTSILAYHSAVQPTLPQRRAAVLHEVELAGERGLTCDELAHAWNVSPNQISGRFTELKKLGLIRSIGRRQTANGCTARAYVAV